MRQIKLSTDHWELTYWCQVADMPMPGASILDLLMESLRIEIKNKLEQKAMTWRQMERQGAKAKNRKITLANHHARCMALILMLRHKQGDATFKGVSLDMLLFNLSKALA